MRIGQDHHQPVDADANAACRGHALTYRFDKFLVERAASSSPAFRAFALCKAARVGSRGR